MNKKNFQKIGGWLGLGFIMLACISTSAPVQVAEPLSMDALGTVIVQTAAAAQTQTVVVWKSPTFTTTPSLTPTLPTPTATFYFSLFTSTPVIDIETTDPAYIVEEGNSTSGGGSSNDPVPYTGKPWTCIGLEKSHPTGAIVQAGKGFTAYWTVLNTGTKTWTSNTVDFVYKSGYRHDGRVIKDISSEVEPGRSLTLKVSFTAPKTAGERTAIWTLKVGNHPFCGMKITFDVKE